MLLIDICVIKDVLLGILVNRLVGQMARFGLFRGIVGFRIVLAFFIVGQKDELFKKNK